MVEKQNARGFHDWIAQRATALIIGIYTLFVFYFLFSHEPLHYFAWRALFSHSVMKIATMIVVLSIAWHAWIGLWTVFTDYIKVVFVRIVLEIVVILALLTYVIWCFDALW